MVLQVWPATKPAGWDGAGFRGAHFGVATRRVRGRAVRAGLSDLGIDELYFQLEDKDVIAKHILALYGSKVLSHSRNDGNLDIELEQETKTGAVYIHNSQPGVSRGHGKEFEKMYVLPWRGGGGPGGGTPDP